MTIAARVSFAVLVLVAALIAEVTVMTRLPLPGATPGLVLVAVAGLGLGYGRVAGAILGFTAGLAVDLAPPAVNVAGRGALVLCLVGYLAGAARERNPRWFTAFAVVAGTSATAPFLYAALGELVGDGVVNWAAVVDLIPFAIGYNLALTPVLVLGILAVARRLEPDVVAVRQW